MKRKWKILLACVVVVAAVAAMTVGICARYVLHYPAVGGDFEISFIRAGETLEDITEQIDQDSSVEINGRDSEGLWHIYLDEDTAVIYDGDRQYPLINGEELLEQLWALLPEQ